MAEVYGAVTDQILINLAKHFKVIADGKKVPGSWEYQVRRLAEMGQINQETEEIILKMLGPASGSLHTLLEESIMDALKGVEEPLHKAAEQGLLGAGLIPPEVAPNQMQAFRAYYRQSANKLNLVNTVMLESTQQAYQATVSDIVSRINRTQGILNIATGEVVTGVTAFNQAVRQGVNNMVKNGLTGFVDHAGHHWSPETYVAMDVRTTMANASRAAVWERQEQYGSDLYQVSHHDGARPLCYAWQGKVISRNDLSRDVEDEEGNTVHVYAQSETTYGQAAGLFGINCKHYPIPFIPGFSRIRPPEQNEEENEKEYNESQKQRELERKLRYEKRDLEILKAQGASDDEIKAQRDRVRAASANLDDFCDSTGRARRRSREYTPVNADWKGAIKNERERKNNEAEYSFLPSSQNVIRHDYIMSDDYSDRFSGITGKPAVDTSIAKLSQTILSHRSGSNYEDLALIDADTGELIHMLDTSNIRNGVVYDQATKNAIMKAKSEGRQIISLHNHPNNYPPSLDDGASAKFHGYECGIVVCHDASIYTFTPTAEKLSEEDCNIIHEWIKDQALQDMDLKTPWFTIARDFGMIIEERERGEWQQSPVKMTIGKLIFRR